MLKKLDCSTISLSNIWPPTHSDTNEIPWGVMHLGILQWNNAYNCSTLEHVLADFSVETSVQSIITQHFLKNLLNDIGIVLRDMSPGHKSDCLIQSKHCHHGWFSKSAKAVTTLPISPLGVFCEVAGLGVSMSPIVILSSTSWWNIAGELIITSQAPVKSLGRFLGISLRLRGVGASFASGLNVRSANRPRKVLGLGFTSFWHASCLLNSWSSCLFCVRPIRLEALFCLGRGVKRYERSGRY